MGFSEEQVKKFQKFVSEAKKPLILFDDDPDGVTSFIMLYHVIGEGRGLPVKKTPKVGEDFVRKVNDYAPDIIFILDKPMVSEDFLDKIKTPIVWLDHHQPQDHNYSNLHYFNPRIEDDADNRPTSYWIHKFIGKEEDLWLAATGVIGDWHVPDFLPLLRKKYPHFVKGKNNIEHLYLDTEAGQLVKMINFNLKGTLTETLKSIKTLLKIEHPDEILRQTTPRGRFIYRHYEKLAKECDLLLERAKNSVDKSNFLIFTYEADQTFTSDISNELQIRFPKKIIIVARLHEGEYKTSLRSATVDIDVALSKSLENIRGYGGGHKKACGACIHEDDWDLFIENFKKEF